MVQLARRGLAQLVYAQRGTINERIRDGGNQGDAQAAVAANVSVETPFSDPQTVRPTTMPTPGPSANPMACPINRGVILDTYQQYYDLHIAGKRLGGMTRGELERSAEQAGGRVRGNCRDLFVLKELARIVPCREGATVQSTVKATRMRRIFQRAERLAEREVARLAGDGAAAAAGC